MNEYMKINTSAEVWAVIRARHPELKVFSSYSAPEGDQYGNPNICMMKTEYGFKDCDYPTVGIETTWDKNKDSYERVNEKHRYWLCIGVDNE